MIDGRIKVGLAPAEFERLLTAADVDKCSTRDLPRLLTCGGLGATTVAATMFVAARVGIRIMATGGLGGVHQGGERTLDVSADLEELARTRVTVVCSGIKSILDQARTLERLESLGVPVVGYGCDELPGFSRPRPGSLCHGSSASKTCIACTRPTMRSVSLAWWWYNRRRATTRCPGCGSSGWSKRRVRRPAPAGCVVRHSRRSCCNTWRSTARAQRFTSTARLQWPMRAWRPSSPGSPPALRTRRSKGLDPVPVASDTL